MAPSAFSFSSPSTSGASAFSSSTTAPAFSFGNPNAPKNPTPLANTFLPPSSSSANGSTNDVAMNGLESDEPDVYEEHLDPPAFTRKDKAKWKASGRSLLAAAAPVGGGVAAWVTKQPSSDPDKPATLSDPKLSLADNMVYISAINTFPPALEHFFSSTCTVYTNLQQIMADAIRLPEGRNAGIVYDSQGKVLTFDGIVGPPDASTIVHMRKIADMYLQDMMKVREADLSDDIKMTFEQMYGIFDLTRILYLPTDGLGQTLLGEELLDWVNMSAPIAINEDGNEIMNTQHPWDNSKFWPFLTRCVLRGFFPSVATFLNTLSEHPHPPIAKLAGVVASYASSFPRSDKFREDHAFLTEHKRWLVRFRSDVDTAVGGRSRGHWFDDDGAKGRSEWSEWEDDFRGIIELMEGKADRLLAEVNDWREAVGAWGVLVDVGLRRDDLPGVMKRILDEIPVDTTIDEDVVLSNICLGQRGIATALRVSQNIDTWLAAHLADIFDKLCMVPDDDDFDMSTRDYLLLSYADSIMDSPSQWRLWRVVAEYLATAAEEGRSRLREYILHVALPFESDGRVPSESDKAANGEDMDVEAADEENDRDVQHFLDLQRTCASLNLHEEWREMCAIMAGNFARRGEYGRAASLAAQARDNQLLSQISEKILATYVERGADEYLKQVNSLPSNLINDAPPLLDDELDGGDGTSPSLGPMAFYAQRLHFLAEFRDYLLFMAEGARERAANRLVNLVDSATTPVAFCAVLLAESIDLLEDEEIRFGPQGTFELLRVLEDVLANARFAPYDYLHQLWTHLARTEGDSADKDKKVDVKEGTELALRKLEVVRLALARNLSRAMVAGIVG